MFPHFEFEAIGTKWIIDIQHNLSGKSCNNLLHEINSLIASFESTFSRFKPDSFISKISKRAGVYEMPAHGFELFSLYKKFYEITSGSFTPLIGQLLEDAGYDSKYSLVQKKSLIRPPAFHDIICFDNKKVEIKKECQLDFGSSGKGYLIDLVTDFLKKNGFTEFIVDAGRDIYYSTKDKTIPKLRVGLENPSNPKQVIGILHTYPNKAVCSSSGSKRKWGNFHHIINPHTLTSPTDVLATWVTANETVLADTIATCLFFEKPEQIRKYYDFAYVVLYSDFSAIKSTNQDVDLFSS